MKAQKVKKDNETNDNNSYIYKIKEYQPQGLGETLSFMLIRPPRFLYNEQLLIPSYKLQGRFTYQTYQIPFPLSIYSVSNMQYVILYLHGNSSSRFEGYMQLVNLPERVGLACFDFNGCGLRQQGNYITLGKNQSKQVDIAAKFLKQKGFKVVGWGRSMGSVSLLLSNQCDVMIADSPFSSLRSLCKQSSLSFIPKICCCFFHCFYPCIQCWIRSEVQNKSGMDPAQLQIIQYCKKIPQHKALLIMAGQNDTMIQSHHSQILYKIFPGKNKKLLLFQGTHNSNRPKNILKQCFKFINQYLNIQMNLDQQYPVKFTFKPIKHKKLEPIKIINPQTVISQSSTNQIELVQQTSQIQIKHIKNIKNINQESIIKHCTDAQLSIENKQLHQIIQKNEEKYSLEQNNDSKDKNIQNIDY